MIMKVAVCRAKHTPMLGHRELSQTVCKSNCLVKALIRATVEGLVALGARVEERPDGMAVHGGARLRGGAAESRGDHRIAMAMGVAGLLAEGSTVVRGAEAAGVSYPGFWDALASLAPPERDRR